MNEGSVVRIVVGSVMLAVVAYNVGGAILGLLLLASNGLLGWYVAIVVGAIAAFWVPIGLLYLAFKLFVFVVIRSVRVVEDLCFWVNYTAIPAAKAAARLVWADLTFWLSYTLLPTVESSARRAYMAIGEVGR